LEGESLEEAVPELPPLVVGSRRSSLDHRPTARMLESVQQEGLAFAAESNNVQEAEERYYDVMHEDEYRIQDEMTDPIAFLANTDEETMYFHQEMKVPDRNEFVKAIVKETNGHIVSKNWELVPRQEVPSGIKVLDYVWDMKQKRDILTRKVLKNKARLNVHRGQQEYAVNFFETYSPVVTWAAVKPMTTLAWLNNWHTRQCDFVFIHLHRLPYNLICT
jgi:glutamine synthetase adenylyltransferase